MDGLCSGLDMRIYMGVGWGKENSDIRLEKLGRAVHTS